MEPSPSEEEKRDAQLEAIFRTHVTDLYRYIYRQVHHASIAEDLTSDIFLKALRWLQLDRSSENVKGWLYATARSLIADYWREQGQLHLLPLEAAEELPLLSHESDEQRGPLQARIQYLLEAKERSVPMELPTLPYDEQSLRVLELTEEEAQALNHNYMGTEHLLLGILHEGSAATELINHGVTLETMRGGVMFIIGRPEWHPSSQMGFTPRTKEVLSLAGKEAQRVGEAKISPHHLLIAILREGQGIAAQLLQVSGLRLEQIGDIVRIRTEPDKEESITLPTDFQQALEQHPAARSLFEKLSSLKQKRIIDQIEQATGEAARSQQVAKTIGMLQQILQNPQ